MPALDSLLALGFEPAAPQLETSLIRLDPATMRLSAHHAAMGTLVTLTAVGPSAAQLEDAAAAAFSEMQRLVAILGRRDPVTPLAHLNRAGSLAAAPAELTAVVRHALAWHHASEGAFDVTVAPLVELFEAHAESASPSLPSDAEVR